MVPRQRRGTKIAGHACWGFQAGADEGERQELSEDRGPCQSCQPSGRSESGLSGLSGLPVCALGSGRVTARPAAGTAATEATNQRPKPHAKPADSNQDSIEVGRRLLCRSGLLPTQQHHRRSWLATCCWPVNCPDSFAQTIYRPATQTASLLTVLGCRSQGGVCKP
eukprot:360647-Chlamydomonas_euryale.AAC.4